jgi:hypothetical protein
MLKRAFLLLALSLHLGALGSLSIDSKWIPIPDCYPCDDGGGVR